MCDSRSKKLFEKIHINNRRSFHRNLLSWWKPETLNPWLPESEKDS